jgi:sugar O-acyltransferase (sialic acid O-acetyltransferase NeuD family)
MKRVVIIGAGAHGREIAEILRQPASQKEPIGFIDENESLKGTVVDDLPILGSWTWFEGVDRSEISVICASGFSDTRKKLVEKATALGLRFSNAISSVSYVSPHATIGEGVVIYQNGIACRGSKIGDHAILNLGAIVSHDSKLAPLVTLNPGVNLAGNVAIGEGCYLGIGSSVIQGVSIGAWTTVGAGAAVISDLPSNVTAVGVPARIIKTKERGWHEDCTRAVGK